MKTNMLPLRLRNGAIGASKDTISVGAYWTAAKNCDMLEPEQYLDSYESFLDEAYNGAMELAAS